jgi:hypothetical protein
MLTPAIEQIKKNWATLRRAPFAFITVAVIAVGLTWGAAKLFYDERISTYKEIIADREERLRFRSPTSTSYSQLNNAELKEKALKLAKKIREFSYDTMGTEQNMVLSWINFSREKNSPEEKRKLYEQFLQQAVSRNSQYGAEYSNKFKSEALLLEEEISIRLPPERLKNREMMKAQYENPGTIMLFDRIATDLERLAESLPISPQ